MAYAAVVSLMNTIQRLFNSSHVSIISSSRKITDSAYQEMESLLDALRRLDDSRSCRKRMNALDAEIRDAVSELEDVLESNLSNQFLSQSEESNFGDNCCSIILSAEASQKIDDVVETLKKMKAQYIDELYNALPEEENFAYSSKIDFDGNISNVVGLSEDDLTRIKQELTEHKSYEFQIVSVVGMCATSRTILAKLVCEESSLSTFIERWAVVTIGPDYQLNDILRGILSQICPQVNYKLLAEEDEYEKLGEKLYTSLKNWKYLIVLNDIRDTQVWNYLGSLFPRQHNGSRVFLTTSLMEVAQFADSYKIYVMDSLNKDESWDLIHDLEPSLYSVEYAWKIARIKLFLSETRKTAAAADEENSEFKDGNDDISEITRMIEEVPMGDLFHDGDVSSRTHSADPIREMIELFDWIVNDDILPKESFWKLKMVSLLGMSGIGKTILAREIFDDPAILHHFELRVWITLGPEYRSENILQDFLAHLDPVTHNIGQKWLIVLDDVWSIEPLHYLDKLFKDLKFEVLLTTTLKEVVHFGYDSTSYKMRLLNNEESWQFLCEKVFADKLCPPELEKAGKMIAEKCEGLPLMIATVASLLSEVEKTPECWTKVAEEGNSVFKHAYDKISKLLYPSYEYMPQHLKACFLYMGVFPQRYNIPTSKLFKLWSSEGIIKPHSSRTLEDIAMEFVMELDSRSLLLEGRMSSSFVIKTSSLHSVYWHLCVGVASKIKFFHVLNKLVDGLEEYLKNQRRLSIQNNTLFGMKDLNKSMASVSTARSLLCTGPHHQYTVPLCFGLGLLRVLDSLTIRFYEFPIKVLHLVLLRYLSLTYDGKLPRSISKLRNLECLIVHQHLNTRLYGVPSYLPKEIWDMKELKHLQVMGSDLPDPCGAILPKLVTLLDISADNCAKCVLQGTPNLRKLGIRIELTPDASEPMFSFDHILHPDRLKSLKCVVLNPELIRSRVVALPPISLLPSCLEKLSLSGFGYPWEYVKTIAWLPNLKALKLRCYAFQGPEWIMNEGEFKKLEFLLLEDSDLEYLKAHNGWFNALRRLIFRHCYKLKGFPGDSHLHICEFELVDCSLSASNHILVNDLSCFANVRSSWKN